MTDRAPTKGPPNKRPPSERPPSEGPLVEHRLTERPPSDFQLRLAQRRARHRGRSRPYRVGYAMAGILVTLAGVIMWGPVPGPGTLVIPLGLAMLALEFAWAERLLIRVHDYIERARGSVIRSRRARIAVVVAGTVGALAASAAAAIFIWDIPLPV